MECVRFLKGLAVSLAVLGFCFPCSVLNAAPPSAPTVTDVALADDGVLLGQVVDPQGAALAEAVVSIQVQDQLLGTAQTNQQGHFNVAGLQPGLYHLSVAESQGTYRLWAPGTAPPSAQKAALVVAGGDTVRGQYNRSLPGFLTNPWVIAAIVATAVAVPVAIHNSRTPSSP